MTTNFSPYATATYGYISTSFSIEEDFLYSLLLDFSGQSSIYWLIAPSNGGDIMSSINGERYELGMYTVNSGDNVVDDGVLDTSFLELDDPGTYDVQSDLTLKSNVIILTNEARQKANSSNQTRIAEDIILDEELNQIIIKNRAKAYAVGDILVLDDSSWKVTRVSYRHTQRYTC